ncbi:hypothetical protein FKM82_013349 [Ascaphus truei]
MSCGTVRKYMQGFLNNQTSREVHVPCPSGAASPSGRSLLCLTCFHC